MKKIKKLVVGNWKMNPQTIAAAKKNATEVKRGLRSIQKTDVVMCPPAVFLGVLQNVPHKTVFLGAQDACEEPMGAFTGEISFSMLSDFNVSHVILGHSERRAKGETDELVNKKVQAVLSEGMTAILCVGESTRDREGNYLHHIRTQVLHGLKDISKKLLDHVVVAYEPIWAIGAKTAMSPRDVHETAIYIKKVLRDAYGPLADGIRILYGGAVDAFNARDIIAGGFVHGFLVGRASLKPKDFLQIIKDTDTQ